MTRQYQIGKLCDNNKEWVFTKQSQTKQFRNNSTLAT